jgi:hypothetical protein
MSTITNCYMLTTSSKPQLRPVQMIARVRAHAGIRFLEFLQIRIDTPSQISKNNTWGTHNPFTHSVCVRPWCACAPVRLVRVRALGALARLASLRATTSTSVCLYTSTDCCTVLSDIASTIEWVVDHGGSPCFITLHTCWVCVCV